MSMPMDERVVHTSVHDYYGRILKSKQDLQTSAS
jgi:hypothetical protein